MVNWTFHSLASALSCRKDPFLAEAGIGVWSGWLHQVAARGAVGQVGTLHQGQPSLLRGISQDVAPHAAPGSTEDIFPLGSAFLLSAARTRVLSVPSRLFFPLWLREHITCPQDRGTATFLFGCSNCQNPSSP